MVGVLPSRRGYALDRRAQHLLRAGLRRGRFAFVQRQRRHHGAGPGAEVLRRDVAASDLAQVGVDVGGGDAPHLAVLVQVLEQLLPGQLLAGAHDLRDAAIAHLQLPGLAALALELEAQPAPSTLTCGCAAW
jgi:hypothetical protein